MDRHYLRPIKLSVSGRPLGTALEVEPDNANIAYVEHGGDNRTRSPRKFKPSWRSV